MRGKLEDNGSDNNNDNLVDIVQAEVVADTLLKYRMLMKLLFNMYCHCSNVHLKTRATNKVELNKECGLHNYVDTLFLKIQI